MRLSRNSSIRLPDSPDRAALFGVAQQQKGSRMRLRPQSLTTAALFALCFLAGFLAHRAPTTRTILAYSPTSFLPDYLPSSLSASRAIRSIATSCRLCDNDPSNPLCEYGDSAIRLSRGYEGSGVRVRKVLEKALRGEEIRFGVIGASVTAGHGLDHGGKVSGPAWPYRFIDEFKKTFPSSRIIDGSAPAMTSRFYSFCWKTMVPEAEADIWLIELDINNEQSQETLDADDALMRSLLDQPNEPAVIRLSVLALSFGDLGRGLASNLLLSQFFDTPIITVKNFLLPYLIQRPDLAADYFTKFPDGKPDLRHINIHPHNALADFLTLYLLEQTCITQQEMKRGRLLAKEGSMWPPEETYGRLPRLRAWQKFSATEHAERITPTCNFASSKSYPLTPLVYSDQGIVPAASSDATAIDKPRQAWQKMEWNDKVAIASKEVGSVIRFSVEGSKVGVFLWQWAGPRKSLPGERPGRAACWVDDFSNVAITLDTYSTKEAAAPQWFMVHESLKAGTHILSCEVANSTSTGGHEVRIMGVVAH
ncbi:hypothetical protein JCM10295v2_006455 [Rhodotorula toruloides]